MTIQKLDIYTLPDGKFVLLHDSSDGYNNFRILYGPVDDIQTFIDQFQLPPDQFTIDSDINLSDYDIDTTDFLDDNQPTDHLFIDFHDDYQYPINFDPDTTILPDNIIKTLPPDDDF